MKQPLRFIAAFGLLMWVGGQRLSAQRADTLVWVRDSLVAEHQEGVFQEKFRLMWVRFPQVPPALGVLLDTLNPVLRQSSVQGAGGQLLQTHRQNLKQAAAAADPNEAAGTQWEYAEVWNVPRNDAQWLTLENSYYEYAGGAHGMYNTQYVNVHRPTNRLVTVTDLFRPGALQRAIDTAEVYFRRAMVEHIGGEYNPTAPLSDAGFWFPDDQFFLPNNFAIQDQQLVFTYNLYSIAPYVVGEITFEVPLSALRKALNPVYFP